MILKRHYVVAIILIPRFKDLMRYIAGGGALCWRFPCETPDDNKKQVCLGWSLGVSLTTKPNKTLLFTEEIHNVDTLKKQGVYTARLSRQ